MVFTPTAAAIISITPLAAVFDYAFLAAALIGTFIGGWLDLKTTEIPDWVPLGMAITGAVIHAVRALYFWDLSLVFWALAVAGGFLAFGYLLYFSGQWGEADVLMLAAIGFLIPQPLSMFKVSALAAGFLYPLTFILNLFVIGAAYSIIYAFILALINKKVFPAFWKDVRQHDRQLAIILGLLAAAGAGAIYLVYFFYIPLFTLMSVLIVAPAVLALYLLYRFAKVLEKVAFKKRIPVARLRPGDMLAEDIKARGLRISSRLYIGLTQKQVAQIKKLRKGGRVWIKEGIRYSISFFFAILATWFFGNVLFVLLGVAV